MVMDGMAMDGDGRQWSDYNSTSRDGVMASQRRWVMRNGESVTAMSAQLAVGVTNANAASKHKM